MVSFQCHACNDVVKKPKLDQHRNRCHSGFDCIDCSKTFNTPAEYKNHTSCISEAEKYEKTLYKGPKTGPQNHYPAQAPQNPPQNGNSSFRGSSRGRGRGGGQGGGWGRQSYNSATGANDTPLGTPRYSPSEPVEKFVQQTTPEVVPATSSSSSDQTTETESKKKEKKRKSIGADDAQDEHRPNKKSKTEEGESTPSEDAKKKKRSSEEKEEKRKQKEAKKLAKAAAAAESASVEGSADVGMIDVKESKEEKKKRRKSKGEDGPKENQVTAEEDKKKRKKQEKETEEGKVTETKEERKQRKAKEAKEKESKEEKKQRKKDKAAPEEKEPTLDTSEEKLKRKKEKEKNKDVAGEEAKLGDLTEKKKEKKKSRKSQHYWKYRDYLSPASPNVDSGVDNVLRESKFKEHGCITPEEFVAAGDFLAYKFPVWTWEKGDSSKAREYLPADKQYIVTRGVPCLRRATSLAYTDADEDAERLLNFDESSGGGDGDDWVETHAGRKPNLDSAANPGEIADIPDDGVHDDDLASGVGNMSLGNIPPMSEIPDIDEIPDMEEEDLEEGDDATAAPKTLNVIDASEVEVATGNLLQVRTYDVMITYDKYYQTPRIWLLGYDENRTPLTPSQIFQDISADHATKTVTIEPFPHSTSLQAASVHPCKHASVMKKVIERMNNSVVAEQLAQQKVPKEKKKWPFGRKSSGTGKDEKAVAGEDDEVEGMRVDFYLVVFLKFIASIVPTIEVDSTTAF
ncbi:autophagocytosis associated protein [Rhodocollybia butyracea]|uniref:Autophagy-related protein 3 n=1 Tax=Rhodocollybia butyracea TaxID=206335 RepID=A0A9P5Q2M0_9AGAR|nr:autophagocytosis associated protein [Rhodocollybia butyracea]